MSSAAPLHARREITERDSLAVLVAVEGVGPIALARMLARLGSATRILEVALRGAGAVPALIAASAPEPGDGRSMPAGVAEALVSAAHAAPAILADIRASGLSVIALGEPAYPPRLAAIATPPHVLFLRGHAAALLGERSLAIVGTRRATIGGRMTASRIAAALTRAGATIVSGLAVGIDGAAHAAVVAEGGSTVAVIAGGHRHLFPSGHRALADAIVAGGGAVVSEHPPGSQPNRGTFPRRNRIISGLADAVIVVEAGARSGALTTAAWALEQGRGCFLVPGAIDAPMSAGCLAFLRECAGEARIVTGVPQLLEDLGIAVPGPRTAPNTRPSTTPPQTAHPEPPSADALLNGLPPATRRTADAVLAGFTTVDELVAVTDLPIGAVLSALTILEMRGLVDGTYGRYHPAGSLMRAGPPKVPAGHRRGPW
jgi:DNA processing protein